MKKSNLFYFILSFSLFGLILIQSCDKENPEPTPSDTMPKYDEFPEVTEQFGQYVLQGNVWGNDELTYSFLNPTSDLNNAEQRQAIVDALDIWAQVSSLSFEEVTNGGDIQISFETGDHGDNCSGDNCVFDGTNGTLAHAFYPPPNGGNIAGDCHFDDDEEWTINFRSTHTQPIDLLTVAIHEVGHSLGISHSAETDAIMYAYYGGSRRELTQDDIDAIQALYPPPTLPNWYISYGGTSSWQDVNASRRTIEDMAFGDINGDGGIDIFISSGGRWLYSNNATSSWIQSGTSNVKVDDLALGDFNGDGKADVFRASGGKWYISYGATSPWEELGISGYELDAISFGDFNGDGKTDIFRPGGGKWNISYGGTTAWEELGTSGYGLDEIAFGDFNGDGKTDVFRPGGGKWNISYGGTTAWEELGTSGYGLDEIAFGDFNGDGKADVFRPGGGKWNISYGGTSAWEELGISNYGLDEIALKDFDGDGKTDVFRTGN